MSRRAHRAWIALTAAWLALVFAAPAPAGSTEDEAARQLTFARTELAAERFDRALSSAESALRLAPATYEALVIKALAYEGLGQTDLALALLAAYVEMAPNGRALSEALSARERILEGLRGGTRRPAKRPSTEVQEATVAALDPEVYRERVVAALAAGRCALASAAAKELLAAMPSQAPGWRLMGDAARCDGKSREAVVAYRRFLELGGRDSAVDSMISGLQDALGSLSVSLGLPEDAAVPRVRLMLGDEQLVPRSMPDGSWRFVDLPSRTELLVRVEGRGLRTAERNVEPLSEGEERALVLRPEWVGIGRLQVADRPCHDCLVRAWIDGEERALEPGATFEVTAGVVDVEVSNGHGTSEVPVAVEARGVADFDPVAWMPSEMTLIGVPAGSRVELRIRGFEGSEIHRELELPVGVGELDREAGVRVPTPQRVKSLVGGQGEITVQHPVLGEGRARLVLEPGAVNATTFNWRTLPGTALARSSFEQWQQQVRAEQVRAATRPLPAALVAMAGGAVAGVLAGLGGEAAGQAAVLGQAYEESLATAPVTELSGRYAAWKAQELESERLLAGAAISGGVAAVGGSITIVLAATGKKPPRVEEWRLELR